MLLLLMMERYFIGPIGIVMRENRLHRQNVTLITRTLHERVNINESSTRINVNAIKEFPSPRYLNLTKCYHNYCAPIGINICINTRLTRTYSSIRGSHYGCPCNAIG
jgi:hypothetical protein